MDGDKLYSKKEISKILNRASEIQTQKDLYGDLEGLTEDELIQLAEEVGIDKSSLIEALNNFENPEFDEEFDWLKGTARVQNIRSVSGVVSEKNWNEIVQEIRRLTGGIGKISKNGNTYEWEQRRRDIGYKHISLTPINNRTNIQMVSGWSGLKFLIQFISFISLFAIASIGMEATSLPKISALLISGVVGFFGAWGSRIFLKSYYEKQKKQLSSLSKAIAEKLSGSHKQGEIKIEEKAVYTESTPSSSSTKDRS